MLIITVPIMSQPNAIRHTLISINTLYHKLHTVYPQLPPRYFCNPNHFFYPPLKNIETVKIVIPTIPYPYYDYSYYFFVFFYDKEEEG